MREYSGSLRICHFKEFFFNTTEKISLSPKLSQRYTYSLQLLGNEFRKLQKLHAINSYTCYLN